MRNLVGEKMVAFRASDTLVSALGETARTSGVTVSEFLRGIVREKVGQSDPLAVMPSPPVGLKLEAPMGGTVPNLPGLHGG